MVVQTGCGDLKNYLETLEVIYEIPVDDLDVHMRLRAAYRDKAEAEQAKKK